MNYLQALESNQDKLEGSAFVRAPREFNLKVSSVSDNGSKDEKIKSNYEKKGNNLF